MKFLVDNWSLLIILACIVGVGIHYVRKFSGLPSEEQLNKVRQYLLYAVIEAERIYQGGTGRLKLSAVYTEFCQVFPSLVPLIPFELFSKMVDDALVEMRKILETNMDIKAYVEGNE